MIGSTLAAAGFALGGPAMQMENLMSANPNQEQTRRGSTPTTTSGGFSSIFNLKSVISAATKQPAPANNSNFYVPPPITVPTAEQAALIESHAVASSSPKSVQGTTNNPNLCLSIVCTSVSCGDCNYLFSSSLTNLIYSCSFFLMKYCFNYLLRC